MLQIPESPQSQKMLEAPHTLPPDITANSADTKDEISPPSVLQAALFDPSPDLDSYSSLQVSAPIKIKKKPKIGNFFHSYPSV